MAATARMSASSARTRGLAYRRRARAGRASGWGPGGHRRDQRHGPREAGPARAHRQVDLLTGASAFATWTDEHEEELVRIGRTTTARDLQAGGTARLSRRQRGPGRNHQGNLQATGYLPSAVTLIIRLAALAGTAPLRAARCSSAQIPARWRPAKPPGAPLLLPRKRPIPQHLSQPQPLRLPPVQDRLHDVRRQAGERQEPADVGVRHALLLRKVGDRLRLTALDPAPPAVRADERLDQRLVAARLRRRRRRRPPAS